MIKEFKEFINKGNVMDLAVGVIVGSAFSKIVSSLVNDVLMPIIGIFIGGLDFSKMVIKINDASINYGLFIQNIVDFLIVAMCVFFIVKAINKLGKTKEELNKKLQNFKNKKDVPSKEEIIEDKKTPVVETPDEVKLLEEIRDLLKKQAKTKK